MRVFEEVLMENGIENFPRTKLGRLFFEMKWRKAKEIFEEFVMLQASKTYLLKDLSRTLKVIWKLEDMPPIPYQTEKVCFSTPEEATREYTERIRKLRELDVLKWYEQTNASLRIKWVDAIVAEAKERGASLVVIKSPYIPYKKNAEIFDEDAKCGIGESIYRVSESEKIVEWVSFDPTNPVKTDNWGMSANTSKVTFIF